MASLNKIDSLDIFFWVMAVGYPFGLCVTAFGLTG